MFNKIEIKNWFDKCEHIWDLKHDILSPLTNFSLKRFKSLNDSNLLSDSNIVRKTKI